MIALLDAMRVALDPVTTALILLGGIYAAISGGMKSLFLALTILGSELLDMVMFNHYTAAPSEWQYISIIFPVLTFLLVYTPENNYENRLRATCVLAFWFYVTDAFCDAFNASIPVSITYFVMSAITLYQLIIIIGWNHGGLSYMGIGVDNNRDSTLHSQEVSR